MINPKIFKAYDIRGIYNKDFNAEGFVDIIKSIYTYFVNDIGKRSLKVIVGRDMRLSSPRLFDVAKKVLLEYGAQIGDVDLVSTPTFYFCVLHYNYDCGIQISASHNPKEYNGVKFVKKVGNHLIKIGEATGMQSIRKLALTKKFLKKSSNHGQVKVIEYAVKQEVDFAFKLLAPKNIKPLTVVADPANAMAIMFLEELFNRLPCKLIKMNFRLDGNFPAHEANPLKYATLKSLQQRVISEKADLGIAPDGDGDRVFFIDEKGNVIPASLITAVIASKILKNSKNKKILIDIRYTRNIANQVIKQQGIPIIVKVGHALITDLMSRKNIIFSGESSGHYFYQATGYVENTVLTILYLLEILGETNQSLSHLVKSYQTSFESGEYNFTLPDSIGSQLLFKQVKNQYADGKITLIDGIAIDFPSWRFSLRSSNTEPLVRLNVEANNRKLLQQKLHELTKILIEFGAQPKN